MKKYVLLGASLVLINSLEIRSDQQHDLKWAREWGQVDRVKQLIAQGVDVNAHPYSDNHLYLTCYSLFISLEMVTVFLEAGIDVNERDSDYGETALHQAANFGPKEVVELLIQYGARVDVKDNKGNTPLHNTARWGSFDSFLILIHAGADYYARNNKGRTVLHKAAYKNLEIVMWLLQKGMDVNTRDNIGNTPLHYAVESGRIEIVTLLIKAGSNVNSKNNWGETPLHTVGRYPEIVKLLLENGAEIDAKDIEGNTPFHLMAQKDYYETVMLTLMNSAADKEVCNKKGYSPLEIYRLAHPEKFKN